MEADVEGEGEAEAEAEAEAEEEAEADTSGFVEDLSGFEIKNKFTISFDICSLFSNIPLRETLNLAVDFFVLLKPISYSMVLFMIR